VVLLALCMLELPWCAVVMLFERDRFKEVKNVGEATWL